MDETLPPYSKEQLVRLFCPDDLPLDALSLFTDKLDAEPLKFAPNDRILVQGEQGDGLYLIAGGTVEVTMRPFGPASPFPPVTLTRLAAGDVVGEMALVKDERRTATVIAVDEVTAYRLSTESWSYVAASYPTLAARIREVANQRGIELVRTDEELLRLEGEASSPSV